MNRCAARRACLPEMGGIQLACFQPGDVAAAQQALQKLLTHYRLLEACSTQTLPLNDRTLIHCRLDAGHAQAWSPGHDTLAIAHHLPRLPDACPDWQLEQEILAAMLASPLGMGFGSCDALASQMRVRRHIAQAARKTALAFQTEAAERPEAFWHYDEEHGFILRPGVDLIEALVSATQPEATGRLYDFSCYRATEYVILLGIARELQTHHPELLQALQHHSEIHAIRSGQFHDVFLVEYGSMQEPLPTRFYVPGDRLWFRNPDERSSDVTGYEGSWVIYMGAGLFSNFWKRDKPFTLQDKCLEIFHWRHGAVAGPEGELVMDESLVDACVAQTRDDPEQTRQVLERMERLRDPKGVYAKGGCIDSTREFPRGLWPAPAELTLPPLPH
jgi:hypothetical protein